MSILILNRFPAHLVKFAEWLTSINDELYMFTVDRYANDFPEYAETRSFANYIESDILEIEAMHLFTERPYRAIIAQDEADILRAARLRERFQLPGQYPESALAFRDKCVMKSHMQSHGIPCPAFLRISSAMDLHDFVHEHGLPVIVKPVDGMGAMNIRVIHTTEQLEDLYRGGIPANVMVEAFIKAQMYEIDGFLLEHKMRFCSVGKYHNNLLAYQENIGNFTELLAPEDPMYQRLRRFVQEVLSALPTPCFAPFHCEVFHTPEDALLFCEIASRSPGARITECIRQSYGIDLDETWAKMEAGIGIQPMETQKMMVMTGSYLIPKKVGKLATMITEFPFPWVTEYQPRVKQGYENPAHMSSSIDIIGSVVFQATSQAELLARFGQLSQYIDQHITWVPLEE